MVGFARGKAAGTFDLGLETMSERVPTFWWEGNKFLLFYRRGDLKPHPESGGGQEKNCRPHVQMKMKKETGTVRMDRDMADARRVNHTDFQGVICTQPGTTATPLERHLLFISAATRAERSGHRSRCHGRSL